MEPLCPLPSDRSRFAQSPGLRRVDGRRRIQGKALPWLLAVVVAAVAGGGWWWSKSADAPASASGTPAGGSAAAAKSGGASSTAGSSPGGQSNARFGGPNRVQPVSVATARKQDVRVVVNAIGTIAAANTAVVRTKVSGELKAIYFREGQAVRAGTVLAQIDPKPFEIALAQAQGTLARDQAQLQNARVDLERFRDLVAKDAAPKQQLDTQDALVRQLQGTVQSDQSQVDNAKLQLSYTRVVAPISGLAGLKQADLGNVVNPSDANGLVTIAQTQPVNVVFAVPDIHLSKLSPQVRGGRAVPVEAWDREQKNKLADGKVASLDNAIDTTTGTIKLKAQFANADGSLYPNQFVNVRVQLDTVADAIAVPSAAVLRGTQGNYVYAVNEDKTVSVRRVRAGATDADWTAVQGEVKAGDIVVTDGTDRLRDGATVEVVVPQPAAGARGGRNRAGQPGTGAPAGTQNTTGAASGATSPLTSGASTKAPEIAAPATAPKIAPAAPAAASNETSGKPAAAGSASPSAANAGNGDRPPWFDRLPPDVQEKFLKMTPQERAAWIQKRREERAKQGSGGAPGNN